MKSPALQAGFERHIHYSRGVLRVCEDLYQLDACSRVLVIAFGGLAHDMAAQLAAHIGPLAGGIVCAPHFAGQSQVPGFRYFHGGHPFPNEESARAAHAILRSLATLDANALVVYLISAGSALVEAPVDEEVTIEDLAETYRVLGESRAKPEEAKAILKHLSAVKGGNLAVVAGKQQAKQVSIFACDDSQVPMHSLACGPTMPDATSTEDCYRVAERYALMGRFPASVRDLFTRRALDETPDKDHPAFHNCRWWPIINTKEQR